MFQLTVSNPAAAESVDAVVVDARARSIFVDGLALRLTPIEYRLLERLVREAGQVVSRDELLSAAREREAPWDDRALDVHVSHLRAKLNGHRSLIRTVRGQGYSYVPRTEGQGFRRGQRIDDQAGGEAPALRTPVTPPAV